MLVRSFSDNSNYHIYWNGSQWLQEKLPWTETSFEIIRCDDQVLALTAVDQDIRLYSLDPDNPLYETPHILASGYVQAPAFTISVDKGALHERAISLLLTLNQSNSAGSETGTFAQPAWILTTPCDQNITLETAVDL